MVVAQAECREAGSGRAVCLRFTPEEFFETGLTGFSGLQDFADGDSGRVIK
jgi:hypothetical protein